MNGSRYGKKQYLNIVRLRAIETNKSILKVADDGLSCVIVPNGSIELFLKKEVEQIQLKIYPRQSIYSKIVNLL
jgi:apolipoprotein N-acyltransferase